MIDPKTQADLKAAVAECVASDRCVLDALREEVRPLRDSTRRIHPRSSTSISLVATDGGTNQLRFDPFLIQLVRIVDSSNNEYCLEAVSPTTSVDALNSRHLSPDGTPLTALGEMMRFLEVKRLQSLSYHIRRPEGDKPPSARWIEAYRELSEWAILFSLLTQDFGTDTLIVRDGLLRSMDFSYGLFARLLQGIQERIETQWRENRRRIYVAGVAKKTKVLQRYHVAMALEGILQTDYPAFVEVPRELEVLAYQGSEHASSDDVAAEDHQRNDLAGGKLFLAKFGARRGDPVWSVDIFLPQVQDAPTILGLMLADAINGFPVPCYPLCLQKAHANAALVDFDLDILQDFIYEGIRVSLGTDASALDAFRLQDANVARRRYG